MRIFGRQWVNDIVFAAPTNTQLGYGGKTPRPDNRRRQLPSFVIYSFKPETPEPTNSIVPPVFSASKRPRNCTASPAPLDEAPKKARPAVNGVPNKQQIAHTAGKLQAMLEPNSNARSTKSIGSSVSSTQQSRTSLKSPGKISLHSLDDDLYSQPLNDAGDNIKMETASIQNKTPTKLQKLTEIDSAVEIKKSSKLKVKQVDITENSFHGNAFDILQKSSTSLSIKNKTGTFSFENQKFSSNKDESLDEGIAYDDGNQLLLEKGSRDVEDVNEELDWKYGTTGKSGENESTKERIQMAVATPHGETKGNNSDQPSEDTGCTEDNTDEENNEEESEMDIEDNPQGTEWEELETAMSIFYPNNEQDPDRMRVDFRPYLTPVTE